MQVVEGGGGERKAWLWVPKTEPGTQKAKGLQKGDQDPSPPPPSSSAPSAHSAPGQQEEARSQPITLRQNRLLCPKPGGAWSQVPPADQEFLEGPRVPECSTRECMCVLCVLWGVMHESMHEYECVCVCVSP